MNETAYKKLSLLIQKYCPDFLADKHSKFISFLKAYYDWSMNVKEFNPWRVTSHLIEWGDIDETLDEFIDYFKTEYLNSLNVDFNGDIREFIKHMKEFYSSRGTPESFRFLLKLLSGNSGEIFYPNEYLMKSSDGEWKTDHCIFVTFDDRIDSSFISTKIQGRNTGITASIEGIETHFNYFTQERFMKVYLSNISGEITDLSVIFDNGTIQVELPLYDTVKSIVFESRGNNYKVGDDIRIPNNPTFVGRVSKVRAGRVDNYAILNGGTHYSVGDVIHTKCDNLDWYYSLPRIYVDEVDPDTGAITSLDIRYSGYGFLELPYVESIESAEHDTHVGEDAEILLISDWAGAISEAEILSCEIDYTEGQELEIRSDLGEGAVAKLSIGKVFDSIPYYYKPGSFLSDEFKLQDSDYWQEYSYEIRSTLTLDSEVLTQFSEYKDIFKKLVHPAGFKLFNSFILSNHIDLGLLYINSTIEVGAAPTFLDLVNWIEMVSSWDRIIDSDIIFQHRFSTIGSDANTEIRFYKRTGGEFVHSTLEYKNVNRYAILTGPSNMYVRGAPTYNPEYYDATDASIRGAEEYCYSYNDTNYTMYIPNDYVFHVEQWNPIYSDEQLTEVCARIWNGSGNSLNVKEYFANPNFKWVKGITMTQDMQIYFPLLGETVEDAKPAYVSIWKIDTESIVNYYGWRISIGDQPGSSVVFTLSDDPNKGDNLFDSTGAFIGKQIRLTWKDSESQQSGEEYILIPEVYKRDSTIDFSMSRSDS